MGWPRPSSPSPPPSAAPPPVLHLPFLPPLSALSPCPLPPYLSPHPPMQAARHAACMHACMLHVFSPSSPHPLPSIPPPPLPPPIPPWAATSLPTWPLPFQAPGKLKLEKPSPLPGPPPSPPPALRRPPNLLIYRHNMTTLATQGRLGAHDVRAPPPPHAWMGKGMGVRVRVREGRRRVRDRGKGMHVWHR